jgi:circadian clock protein KaiB
MDDQDSTTRAFESAIKSPTPEKYILHLYVAGMSSKSLQAVENIKRICEEYLPGRYQLDVIDIYQQPLLAKNGQIVAAPTLIKELPLPLRKLIGSMSDTERVLVGLDVQKVSAAKNNSLPKPKDQESKSVE